jgi:hypothetical protein
MQDCLFLIALFLAIANAQEQCAIHNKFGTCVADEASCRGITAASSSCPVRNADLTTLKISLQSQEDFCCLSATCIVDKDPFKCLSNHTCLGIPTESSMCTSAIGPEASCCVQKACSALIDDDKLYAGTCVPEGLQVSTCLAMFPSTQCPSRSTCCIDKDSIVVVTSSTTSTRATAAPATVGTVAPTSSSTSTSSVASPARFPVAIVAGCVVGIVVLIAVALTVFFVMKKRRRADQQRNGGDGVPTSTAIGGNTNTAQIGDSNRSQYAMISLRPPEVELGAPYGSTSSSTRQQYTDLQMTPTTPMSAQVYDVVPSELNNSV